MLQITNKTTKKELLQSLTQLANKKGELIINIDSLPSFIATEVSFNVFNYQISNYPREIQWRSENPKIVMFLKDLQANLHEDCNKVETKQAEKNQSQTDTQIHEQIKINKPESLKSHPHPTQQSFEKRIAKGYGVTSYGVEPDRAYTEKKGTNNLVNNQNQSNQYTQPQTESIKQGLTNPKVSNKSAPFAPPVPEKVAPTLQNQKPFSEKFLDQETYQPSSLIKNEQFKTAETPKPQPQPQPQPPQEVRQTVPQQSKNTFRNSASLLEGADMTEEELKDEMDGWLDRIYSAKEGLSKIKDEKKVKQVKKDKRGSFVSGDKTPLKNLYFVTASLVVSFLIVGIFIFFPTNAYTVEINPSTIESSTIIKLDQKDFTEKKVELEAKSEIATTGTKELETTNASGTVSLINTSGGDINISNGRFYLYSNGKKYTPLKNDNYSKTITIPARNDLHGPEITVTVVASEAGTTYDLTKGATFTITNLYGLNVGRNLYGLAKEDILSADSSTKKYVTETDLDLLKTTNEGELAKQRVEEIGKIQDNETFTNQDWYVDTETRYKYTNKVGESVEKVGLETETTTQLYFLSKELLETEIINSNQEIYQIVEIRQIDITEGEFGEKGTITLDVFYKYSKKTDFNENEIKELLKDGDYEEAKYQIQEQYPEVYIEKKELGVKIPGIKPRADFNIVKN